MSDGNPYELRVEVKSTTAAEANRSTSALAGVLAKAAPDVEVKRANARTDTMDLGTTLVLVLGTPAVAASLTHLARGVFNWLTKTGDQIEVERPDGTRIKMTGEAARNAPDETLRALAELLDPP